MTDSPRRSNSLIVNLLTKEEVDGLVKTWLTGMYKQGRGIQRKVGLSHPTPYLVMVNGHLYANPYAFSSTKSGTLMEGYPTFPFKPLCLSDLREPPSTNKKSSWVPRLPVHSVLFRWFNKYCLIPDGADVSHLRNDSFLVTPNELHAEDGVLNRSRTACFKYGWYKSLKSGCPSKHCLRCPHEPLCLEPLVRPPLEVFSDPYLVPVGLGRVFVQ